MLRRPTRRTVRAAATLSFLALAGMLTFTQLTAGAQGVTLPDEDLELVADVIVTRDGAVIEGLHVLGDIEVRADDVVIRQVKVTSDDSIPIRIDRNARNLLVEDSTVVCESDRSTYGIGNDHYRAERVELVGCPLGFRDGTGVTVVDSSIDGVPHPEPAPSSTEVPTAMGPTATTEPPTPTTAAPTPNSPDPVPTTNPVAAEEPAATSVLRWSASPDRSDPATLEGDTVPERFHVFLDTDATGIESVAWYLDGVLIRDDDLAEPWDMFPAAAGRSGVVRVVADDGPEYLATAVLNFFDDRQETVNARFAVQAASSGASEPEPEPEREAEPEPEPEPATTPATRFPDAASTGVQDGVTLQPVGSLTVTEDGTVLEGLDVSGRIEVLADDVVIRNVRVSGSNAHLIRNRGRNLLIEHVTLRGQQPCSAGIAFNHYTARHVDVSGCADGLKANNDVVIERSYIHGLRKWAGTHNDGIQGTGGSNIVIRDNRIEGPWRQSTSAIKLDSHNRHLDDVLVQGNLISGGGFSVYLEAKGAMRAPTNARIVDNVFVAGSMTWAWLRVTSDPTQVISGNTWDDGTPIG